MVLTGYRAHCQIRMAVRDILECPAGKIVASRFNPITEGFHQRLFSAGKQKKQARSAGMCKPPIILNSMLQSSLPWNQLLIGSSPDPIDCHDSCLTVGTELPATRLSNPSVSTKGN